MSHAHEHDDDHHHPHRPDLEDAPLTHHMALVEALEQWRSRLFTLIVGLRTQNEMIGDMDQTANAMVTSARIINDQFVEQATSIGNHLLGILVLGAGFGLLIGGATAIFVARSITRPLQTLQKDMVTLASDPAAADRLAINARTRANATGFRWRDLLTRWEEIYRRAAQAHARTIRGDQR